MKRVAALALLGALSFSCSHKSETKPKYNPQISYEMDGAKYQAKVNLPKNFKDKLPLVVIVHEWWGKNDYIAKREQMLNEQGYATLAVDMFGNNKVVDNPKDAQVLATPFYQKPEMGVERLQKYIEVAKQDPHVDASKVFVIGYCFGGTQALNYARSGADVKGVVSFHGGLATSLPQKQIKAKVLALNGAADPMVPAKEVKGFEAEMKAQKVEYKVVNYKGATHAFSNPNSTAVGKKYNIPIAYNKAADEASWQELMTFLKQ